VKIQKSNTLIVESGRMLASTINRVSIKIMRFKLISGQDKRLMKRTHEIGKLKRRFQQGNILGNRKILNWFDFQTIEKDVNQEANDAIDIECQHPYGSMWRA